MFVNYCHGLYLNINFAETSRMRVVSRVKFARDTLGYGDLVPRSKL